MKKKVVLVVLRILITVYIAAITALICVFGHFYKGFKEEASKYSSIFIFVEECDSGKASSFLYEVDDGHYYCTRNNPRLCSAETEEISELEFDIVSYKIARMHLEEEEQFVHRDSLSNINTGCDILTVDGERIRCVVFHGEFGKQKKISFLIQQIEAYKDGNLLKFEKYCLKDYVHRTRTYRRFLGSILQTKWKIRNCIDLAAEKIGIR